MNQALDGAKTRKLLVQTFSGAVVGAAVSYFFFSFGKGVADFDDPSRLAAAGAGIIYVLMGLIVGLGTLMPGAGAKFLNVEDADEIVEERAKIGPGAFVCLLTGVLLIALSLTPSGELPGAVSRDVAAWIAAGAFAVLIAVSLRLHSRMDELNQSLGREASALAMNVSVLIFGGWAALAHLGYVGWIEPLGLLAGFALVQLASIFWVKPALSVRSRIGRTWASSSTPCDRTPQPTSSLSHWPVLAAGLRSNAAPG